MKGEARMHVTIPDVGCAAITGDGRCVALGGARRFPEARRGTGTYRVPVPRDGAFEDEERRPLLRILDLEEGTARDLNPAHRGPVSSLAFTPDSLVLAGSGDSECGGGEIRMWDPQRGECLWTCPAADRDRIVGLAPVAPDAVLAACGWDNVLRQWHLPTGTLQRELSGHTQGPAHMLTALAVTPDGTWAASAGHDGLVKVWSLPDGTPVQTFRAHEGHVSSLALTADARWLATGSADGTARRWEVERGRLAGTFGHGSPVWKVALSADGQRLALCGFPRILEVWSADGNRIGQVDLGAHPAALAFTAEELLAVTQAGRVLAFDGRLRERAPAMH